MADKVLVPYTIPYDDFSGIAIGATASTSPSITIGPFPFIWTTLGVHFVSGTSTDITILIRDEGKARDFMKDKAHLLAMINTEDEKYYLPVPWHFVKHSSIYIEILNNSATLTATFKLAFMGFLEMPVDAWTQDR